MLKNDNNTISYSQRFIFRTLAILVGITLMLFTLIGCGDSGNEEPETVIGEEGITFARTIATRYPYRAAGTPEEKAVADLIFDELDKMGYKPTIQEFTVDGITSQNIIVDINGNGFEVPVSGTSDEETVSINRSLIIGAHYDTPLGMNDLEEYPDYNGIHDNAAGVGALISIAKELRYSRKGYDITLVFFGAGSTGFLGSKTYAASLSAEKIADTDAMYCIDSIYAGDKLYAHSGYNSLIPGKKYINRRKLYEMSDVAIANSIDLRFNESDLDVDVNADSVLDVYREISINKSDYNQFDNLGIPCVYIESYEYFSPSITDQTESKNPYFGNTNGIIKGTGYDDIEYLETILDKNRLETRIKNVAFLVIKAIDKGIYK